MCREVQTPFVSEGLKNEDIVRVSQLCSANAKGEMRLFRLKDNGNTR